MAVDENQLAGSARYAMRAQAARPKPCFDLDRAAEWNFRERREIGETPIFVVRRGKSLGAEARPAVFAQLLQPHRLAPSPCGAHLARRLRNTGQPILVVAIAFSSLLLQFPIPDLPV
jgi:hypothetical protein